MAQLPWQPNFEPKRDHKFILQLANIPAYFITDVSIPKATVGAEAAHNFLSHKFKFPGKLTWEDSSFTLVDPIDFNAANLLMKHIKSMGYVFPSSFDFNDSTSDNYYLKTVKKGGPADPNINVLNKLTIISLDSNGTFIEGWKLQNSFIKTVSFGEKLQYAQEGIRSVNITLSVDWVDYENYGLTGSPVFNTNS